MRQTTRPTSWWRYRLWLLCGAVGYYLASGTSQRAADAVGGAWALVGIGLLIAWLWRRSTRVDTPMLAATSPGGRTPLRFALAALWLVAVSVAAMPRTWHVHGVGTALVVAAAAATMLWFVRRHPRLVLSLLAIVGLTNWISARGSDSHL